MAQNAVEKIVQAHAVGLEPGHEVRSGEYVTVRPRHVLTHDNTAAVMLKFAGLGCERVADSTQPVFALDHNVQDRSAANLDKYRRIEAFAARHGIDFHPAGRGIGHQVMVEEGYAWPGSLVVASDSHANLYGGIGALGTPVVRTDAAALWATGETWWQVPPVTRVELFGELAPGVSGKDLILTLCSLYDQDEVLNHAIEFTGPGVASLDIEARLTVANMTTEWGALAGLFPIDERTLAWCEEREGIHPAFTPAAIAELRRSARKADPDAAYAQVIEVDLGRVRPWVCGPDSVKEAAPAAELAERRIAVNKAYLLSCVNGRTSDLAAAAAVLKGRRVVEGVEFYVAAASDEVQRESEARGDWGVLLAAGARPLPPGCGPCIGLGAGLLEDGEIGISATNRNFKGRMGSREARAYLASPAVVAASAAAGFITAPEGADADAPERRLRPGAGAGAAGPGTRILPGFPTRLRGELLFCDADNLNTDGIYPGKYTYREDLSPEEMAAAAMENYDPAFQDLARAGDFLVGGANFGTGSSREQAATALAHRGIRLVVAASFSATYKRNAFNNGFLLVDCPDLVAWLRRDGPASAPTVRTGIEAEIDFAAGTLTAGGESFAIAPLGPAAQELVLAGGLEAMVRSRLEKLAPPSGADSGSPA
ncbi:MAG: homoaconitase [Planctomycetota bacterium]|nr:MAG: homoaconitase [Planctomycetota bacterium]